MTAAIYASPSKSPVTEPFSKTARIVLASSGAMDKTVSWGKRLSSPIGSVFVTITSRAPQEASRCAAGSESTPGCRDDHVTGAVVVQQCHRAGDGAAGVDHVVNQDTGAPGHVADDAVGHHLVGYPRITGLVDEGEGNTT